MNIDELFVANQKEGTFEYLTTCFDEQTSFTPKVHAFAIVKIALFFVLQNVAVSSNYIQKLLHMLW